MEVEDGPYSVFRGDGELRQEVGLKDSIFDVVVTLVVQPLRNLWKKVIRKGGEDEVGLGPGAFDGFQPELDFFPSEPKGGVDG